MSVPKRFLVDMTLPKPTSVPKRFLVDKLPKPTTVIFKMTQASQTMMAIVRAGVEAGVWISLLLVGLGIAVSVCIVILSVLLLLVGLVLGW